MSILYVVKIIKLCFLTIGKQQCADNMQRPTAPPTASHARVPAVLERVYLNLWV